MFKLGLIRSSESIGYLLRNKLSYFQNRHFISDIFRMMEANCSRYDKFFV